MLCIDKVYDMCLKCFLLYSGSAVDDFKPNWLSKIANSPRSRPFEDHDVKRMIMQNISDLNCKRFPFVFLYNTLKQSTKYIL